MKRNIQWLIPVLICLVVSVMTLFLPIFTYTCGDTVIDFDIRFIIEKPHWLRIVLSSYSGPFVMDISPQWAIPLIVMAVGAIIAAFVGVITMSSQRPNTWQFILALVGIVGTMIPSVLVFLMTILSKNYFTGSFSPGVYPILTPITMVLCLITVTRRHKRTRAEFQAIERAKHLMRPAGDL